MGDVKRDALPETMDYPSCRAVVRVPYENYQPRHCLRPIAFDDPDLPMCAYHYTMAAHHGLDFEVDTEGKYPDAERFRQEVAV
jgi:hypothetical protein